MPTHLEELVEFLHHGNTQIRQLAVENLVPFSRTQPELFKTSNLAPVRDLKLLIKDYAPIAKNALTILINISSDKEVLEFLIKDDAFLETVLFRITNTKEPNANELAMLLANMAKDDRIERLFTMKRDAVLGLSKSRTAIDQLMDCFVKGAAGAYNPKADFDYLAYLFADLAKFPKGSVYLTTPQPYDEIYPLAKLLPFTTHPSHTRRLGVASAIKNTTFPLSAHPTLLSSPLSILPYIVQPLMSDSDTFSEQESDLLPEELQLLPPDARREPDPEILRTHLETLLLLTGTREGRDGLRGNGVYAVVRECHLHVEDEGVREGCERLVQVIMRDEEGEGGGDGGAAAAMAAAGAQNAGATKASEGRMVTGAVEQEEEEKDDDDDEDHRVVEIDI